MSDLFFNTPARMKFLKKDVSEGNLVRSNVERLSLSHPEISFRFIRDGKTVFTTPGTGDAYQAVFSVFPREIAEEMIYVSYGDERCHVEGYASKPDLSRKSRSWQYLYVNGRYVKLRNMSAAVEEAYRNLSMSGRYPSFLLNIYLPADSVDVNVHPAKTEVRFADERMVARTLYIGVKSALDDTVTDFGRLTKHAPEAPAAEPEAPAPKPEPAETEPAPAPVPQAEDQSGNPFGSMQMPQPEYRTGYFDRPRHYKPSLDIEVESFEPAPAHKAISFEEILGEEAPAAGNREPRRKLRLIGEAFSTYIIAELDEDIIFIDKHAAHERILFETLNERDLTSDRQILAAPVVVSMSQVEKDALLAAEEDVRRIGFVIDDFGDSSVSVREVPVYQKSGGIEDAVLEMAHQLVSGGVQPHTRETEWLLHSVSCRSAIKAGHKTTAPEMIALCEQIVNGDVPKFCPHGRPVFFLMSRKELEKRCGRDD